MGLLKRIDTPDGLKAVYEQRFSAEEKRAKEKIWKTLCANFFQRYVSQESAVLEVGAGYCEFINNIKCKEKYAVDLNKDFPKYAKGDVKTLVGHSTHLSFIRDNTVDIVFMSNLLEHMETKRDVLRTLRESWRVLRKGGSLLIMQPNIKYLAREYWDFFDHNIPLSHNSLGEAMNLAGFKVTTMIPRFLPYTTKSNIPKSPFLIKLYLKLPLFWKIIGKQMFAIGRKP